MPIDSACRFPGSIVHITDRDHQLLLGFLFGCVLRFGVVFTGFFAALPPDFLEVLTPALAGASSGINLPAIGDPSPVQGSHPGPAEKPPLLP